jgi:hypothetical protein
MLVKQIRLGDGRPVLQLVGIFPTKKEGQEALEAKNADNGPFFLLKIEDKK